MRFNRKRAGLAMLTLLILSGAGCSGINASKGFSPLMFLLPGLGQTSPAPADDPVPQPQPVQTVALAQ